MACSKKWLFQFSIKIRYSYFILNPRWFHKSSCEVKILGEKVSLCYMQSIEFKDWNTKCKSFIFKVWFCMCVWWIFVEEDNVYLTISLMTNVRIYCKKWKNMFFFVLFQTFFDDFNREKVWNEQKNLKTAEKSVSTSFWVCTALKSWLKYTTLKTFITA